MVEAHESLPREELFIKSDNSLLPVFFANILMETANKVGLALCIVHNNYLELKLPPFGAVQTLRNASKREEG